MTLAPPAPHAPAPGRSPARDVRDRIDSELLWVPPGRNAGDWVEFHALATAGGPVGELVPVPPERVGLPMPTLPALRRALVLLFAHGIDAHAHTVVDPGRRAVARHFALVPRDLGGGVRARLDLADDLLAPGRAWLDGNPDAVPLAQGLWRGLLLSTPFVRTRGPLVTLRVASPVTCQAALGAAAVLGLPVLRQEGRREQRLRLALPAVVAEELCGLLGPVAQPSPPRTRSS